MIICSKTFKIGLTSVSINMDSTNKAYNPADDGNQGVVQLIAQSEESTESVAQARQMSPITASGPEPEKAEVSEGGVNIEGVNDDILAEEEVENAEADTITE